jgi:hypothetical protein
MDKIRESFEKRPPGLCSPGLKSRAEKSFSSKSWPSALKFCAVPFGTRLINLILPALTCRATGCTAPAGLASLQCRSSSNLTAGSGKGADAGRLE